MKKVIIFNLKKEPEYKIHDEEVYYPEVMEDIVKKHVHKKKKSKFKVVKEK